MSFFSFGKKKKKEVHEKSPLIDVFGYLKSISTESGTTQQYWNNLLLLQQKFPTGDNKKIIKLYFTWENYAVSTSSLDPENNPTSDSIRTHIRENIDLSKLDSIFSLIFLESPQHETTIYQTFLQPAVQFYIQSHEIKEFQDLIEASSKSPFFKGLLVTEKGFDFTTTNEYIKSAQPSLEEIQTAFKALYSLVYNKIFTSFDQYRASQTFEQIYADIRDTYDQDIAAVYLHTVPESSLGFDQWLSLLTKKELEGHVKQKTVELQNLNETLEQKVAERTAELQKAYEELKELDERKSEFISVVAHQLRTPLNGLKWTLDMFLKGDLGPITPDQREFVTRSYKTNDYLLSIVNQMLDTEQISSGKDEFAFRKMSIFDVIETVQPLVTPNAEQRFIDLYLPPRNSETPDVYIDSEKLKLVIQNLLDNAIKYTPEHGHVQLEISYSEDKLAIGVSDSGIGISKKDQKYIFGRFFRADNAKRSVANGSGLGLFIAKHVVERHGGKIWFESVENEGTTFFIEIPIHPPQDVLDHITQKPATGITSGVASATTTTPGVSVATPQTSVTTAPGNPPVYTAANMPNTQTTVPTMATSQTPVQPPASADNTVRNTVIKQTASGAFTLESLQQNK